MIEAAKNTRWKNIVTYFFTPSDAPLFPEGSKNLEFFALVSVGLDPACPTFAFVDLRGAVLGIRNVESLLLDDLSFLLDNQRYTELEMPCTMSRLRMYPEIVDHNSTVVDKK